MQVLERLDPDPKFFEGKRGACVGFLQLLIAGQESPARFKDTVGILKDSTHPGAEPVIKAMLHWGASNGMPIA